MLQFNIFFVFNREVFLTFFLNKRVVDVCIAKHKNTTLCTKVLSKDMIEIEIIPHLPKTKRGFKLKVLLYEIINSILYKLKTGDQWEYLSIDSLFSAKKLHYKTVFGHYRK